MNVGAHCCTVTVSALASVILASVVHGPVRTRVRARVRVSVRTRVRTCVCVHVCTRAWMRVRMRALWGAALRCMGCVVCLYCGDAGFSLSFADASSCTQPARGRDDA